MPAGGRYDLGFVMPRQPVRLELFASDAALALSADGRTTRAFPYPAWTDFDPLDYGSPAPTPFSAASHFDRAFTLRIQRKLGFENGRPGFHWALERALLSARADVHGQPAATS